MILKDDEITKVQSKQFAHLLDLGVTMKKVIIEELQSKKCDLILATLNGRSIHFYWFANYKEHQIEFIIDQVMEELKIKV